MSAPNEFGPHDPHLADDAWNQRFSAVMFLLCLLIIAVLVALVLASHM